jgi:hypothetical protein
MKIGDYVTVQQIADQSECRWVVLADLVESEYGGSEAGIIQFIGDNEEAGDVAAEFSSKGIHALLVCGALEPLCVGGIFVE